MQRPYRPYNENYRGGGRFPHPRGNFNHNRPRFQGFQADRGQHSRRGPPGGVGPRSTAPNQFLNQDEKMAQQRPKFRTNFFCSYCKITVYSEQDYNNHCQEIQHCNKVAESENQAQMDFETQDIKQDYSEYEQYPADTTDDYGQTSYSLEQYDTETHYTSQQQEYLHSDQLQYSDQSGAHEYSEPGSDGGYYGNVNQYQAHKQGGGLNSFNSRGRGLNKFNSRGRGQNEYNQRGRGQNSYNQRGGGPNNNSSRGRGQNVYTASGTNNKAGDGAQTGQAQNSITVNQEKNGGLKKESITTGSVPSESKESVNTESNIDASKGAVTDSDANIDGNVSITTKGNNEADKKQGETGEAKEENEEEEEGSDSDEDTDYCKYCKLNFTSARAYHAHTRGLQHTSLIMEAKAAKGDKNYQKEQVAKEVLEVKIPAPKEVAMETKDEEEVIENWMDLDDDMMELVKERQDPSKRDLTPADIGKSSGAKIHCAVCDIHCTGPMAFQSHLDGRQHKQNMANLEQGVQKKKKMSQLSAPLMVDLTGQPSKLSELVANNTNPMLGMEYVTEFQRQDPKSTPRYVCNLCEVKCDGSTIVPHIIGIKHRLLFIKTKKPQMYQHLMKYSSVKKKSELTSCTDDFAKQLEEEYGRQQVKVRREIEDKVKECLEERMKKTSEALQEKVANLKAQQSKDADEPEHKRAKLSADGQENPQPGTSKTGPSKAFPPHAPHQNYPARGAHRKAPYHDPHRDPYYPHRDPYGPHRDPYHDTYFDPHRYPHPDPYHGPHRDPYRDPYYDHPAHRGRYPHEVDFRRSYNERFDPYRRPEDDPFYERRLLDERNRLDTMMLDRYRLSDPLLERKRLDDIMARREYLDSLETKRLNDILERKKRLEESDVDLLRLRRFMDRDPGKPADPSPATQTSAPDDYTARPSMEEIIARRRAAQQTGTAQPDHVPPLAQPTSSSDQGLSARQIAANKALQEEVQKNPGVDVGEILKNLMSSAIASENDADMALQISNALTNALLQYRLQNFAQDVTEENQEPAKPEPVIPGLGTSSTGSAVPSFLRSPATPSQQTPDHTQPGVSHPTYSPHLQQSPGISQGYSSYAPGAVTADNPLVTSVPIATVAPEYSMTQQSHVVNPYSNVQTSVYGAVNSQIQPKGVQNPVNTSYVSPVSNVNVTSYPMASEQVIAQMTKSSSVTAPVTKILGSDQPQKQLLESIRKQTELLKKKIEETTRLQVKTLSMNVATTGLSGIISSSYNPSVAGVLAGVSQTQGLSVGQHMTHAQPVPAPGHLSNSAYSQWYQQNYGVAPPNPTVSVDFSSVHPALPQDPTPQLPPLPSGAPPPLPPPPPM